MVLQTSVATPDYRALHSRRVHGAFFDARAVKTRGTMVDPQTPQVSFGLPVRNGEASIAKCLDSILAQDFTDFEVVVCDNQSTDGTRDIVEAYAAQDERVRFAVNETDIGLVANFNKVVREARGEYFRWVGADDWLEPGYTTACVQALDADRDAIAATTYFGLHRESGIAEFEEYRGEYPDSTDASRRVSRMLRFFHAGAAAYEPTYAMMRRDVLESTQMFAVHRHQDWLLSVELCLAGRFIHVPECLFHRNWPEIGSAGHYLHLAAMYPERKKVLEPSTWRLMRALRDRVAEAKGLGVGERIRCHVWIACFGLERMALHVRRDVRKFRRQELGLTRKALRGNDGS